MHTLESLDYPRHRRSCIEDLILEDNQQYQNPIMPLNALII